MTQQLDDLLNTLSNKFAGVSSEIFAKSESQVLSVVGRVATSEQKMTDANELVDEMSRRIDNLEAALVASNDRDSAAKQS